MSWRPAPAPLALALLLVASIGTWATIDRLLTRDLARRHDGHVADTVRAARAVVDDAGADLLREARMLAGDPAVIEGTLKGDWGILARGASPRMVALTVERVADVLLILDAGGAPLLQVPATLRIVTTSLGPRPEPASVVQPVNGRPFVFGLAPIQGRTAPAGLVAVGRSVEGLERRVSSLPGGPMLVGAVGDRPTSGARGDLPSTGWQTAAPRALMLDGQVWTARPLGDGLWLLLTESEYRAEVAWLRRWLLAGLALAGAAVLAAAVAPRGRRRAARGRAAPGVAPADASGVGDGLPAATAGERVFDAIAKTATSLLGAKLARVWIADEDGRLLRMRGIFAVDPELARLVADFAEVASGEGVAGAVFASGVAQFVEDVQHDPRWLRPEIAARAGLRAHAGVPLVAGERVVGVLTVTFGERRGLDAAERELVRLLAVQAAHVIVNAQLLAEERARRGQLAALLEINKKIGAAESSPLLLRSIAEEAARLLGVDNAGFRLVEGDELVVAGLAGSAPETMLRPRIKIGESFSGRVVLEGRTIVADIRGVPGLVPEHRAADERLGYTTFLGVPLRAGDRVIGVLAFRARRSFTAQDRELAEAFAAQAAVALEHARLYREASRQAERMAALADVERLLSETLDPAVVAQRVVDNVCALLEARSAVLYRQDQDTGRLQAVTVSRDVGSTFYWTSNLPEGAGLAGLAVAEREPRSSADVLADPRLRYEPQVRARITEATHRALLAVPLLVQDRVFGALAVGDHTGRVFTDDDVHLAQTFARQAALVLENARLFSLETARSARIEALAEVERELTAELNLDRLLGLVVDRTARLFAARGLIYLAADGDALVPAAGSGEALFTDRFRFGEGVVGMCATERQGIIVNDYARAPSAIARYVQAGLKRVMAYPLLARDQLLGVISMSRFGDDTAPFAEDDLSTLGSFAAHVSVAVENARLYDEAEQRRREAEELARLARELTTSLQVAELGPLIVDSVLALFHARSVGLRLLAADGSLVAVAWGGSAPEQFELGHAEPAGTGLSGRAVAAARPLWSADVLDDPDVALTDDMRQRVARYGHRAVLTVPLNARERIIGVLVIADGSPHRFTDAQVALAQAFADQAALALERARLHEETERRRRVAEILADLARSINATRELDAVLERVAAGARELCSSDLARIALREPGVEEVRFRYCVGARYAGYADFRVEPGKGLSGRVLLGGQPFRTDDYAGDPGITKDYLSVAEAEGIVAELAVPIRIGERIEGVLNVSNRTRRAFTDWQEGVLLQLADHAAIAIQNARLYESLAVRATRLRTLADVNRLVSSSLDTQEVLAAIARAASRLMAASVVAFWVADEATETLRRSSVSDERVEEDFPLRTLRFGEGAVGWVAARRHALNIADVASDRRFLARDWSHRHGLASFFAVPIVLRDSLLGVLTLSGRTPFQFGPDDTSLLDTFTAQAAVALDHARLYAETRQRLAETRALLDVVEILNSTLDPRQLLKRVTMKIAQVCAVDRCSIERWEGDRVVPLMSQFADGRRKPALWEAFMGRTPHRPTEVAAHAQAIATRAPVLIDDTATSTLIPGEWIETYRLKSYMAVPLVRQDRVIGVMNLDYCERVTPFQPWQVELATAIAGQLALSLENTRLFTEAQERLRETTTLLAVGRVLSQPAPVGELMRRVVREVARAFGADTAGGYVLDREAEVLRPVAGYHVPAELREPLLTNPIALSRLPRLLEAWKTGRPIWSADTRADERFDQGWVSRLPPHAVLLAPTRVRGESVGGLFLVWWRPGREFLPPEIRLIEGVAAQIGLALENAELTQQREAKLQETETLLTVSRALSTTLDLQSVMRQLLRAMVRALGADSAAALTCGDDGEWLQPLAGYRVPPTWLPVLRGLRVSIIKDAFYAEAARTRRAVFYADPGSDPRLPDVVRRIPHRSQLFVPIVVNDRVVGGLGAVWWSEAHRFSPSEIAMVEAIANQAAVALDNAHLFEQNRRQVEELSGLHELSRAVTGQLDRHAVLAAMRLHVPRVLDARKMVVLLFDEATGELDVALRVLDGAVDEAPPRRLPHAAGLLGVVLAAGQPLRTDDYASECARRGLDSPDAPEPCCWIGVPLKAGDAVLGALALSREAGSFSDAEARLAGNVADLAALALRSARLYEERTRAYSELAATQDHLVRTEKLRALGEMASGVAHDFNNLLAAILGRTQLLLRRIEDPKLRGWLSVVERAALDGAQTVRRLQDFARVRRDQPLVPVNLNEIVRDALEITQSRWREESLRQGVVIEVRTQLAAVPHVAGDGAELREAMTNLILNAIDAMPHGGTLTVSTAVVKSRVEVTVTDTGIGIPEDIRQKIFDPFFTTKGPKGTGLGLSMTYGIVSRHGAAIAVESEPGSGTTFRLTFPALATSEVAGAAAPAETTVATALRCLVVDDEPSVGSVLGDMLEAAGHRAVVLTHGAAAIERFRAEPFDVVFTDLAMPEVSGWQVAHAVKASAAHVPVFIVTGFGVELSPEERRAHGVEAVFAKPLRIDDVMDAIEQVARKRAKTE